MKWEVTTAPASLPVDYSTAAAHLRLDQTYDTVYVNLCIADACDFAQSYMECSLLPQTITASYYNQPVHNKFYLPRGPVRSITSITANGVTVSSTAYTLKRTGNTDYLDVPGTLAVPVVVVYSAGYTAVPNDMRRGLLLHIAHMYENREAQNPRPLYDLNFGLTRIYDSYKRNRIVG